MRIELREKKRESPAERTRVKFPVAQRPDLLPDNPGYKKSELREHDNCRERGGKKPELTRQ